jgi:hypothetical protein
MRAIQDWRWMEQGGLRIRQSFIVRVPEEQLLDELDMRREINVRTGQYTPNIVDVDDEPAETYEFTIHRSELIPGGNGARIGFSDDFPGKQFLIVPQEAS